jgi:ribosomal protein S16
LRRLDFFGQPQRSLTTKNEEVGFFSTNRSTRALKVVNEEVGFFRPTTASPTSQSEIEEVGFFRPTTVSPTSQSEIEEVGFFRPINTEFQIYWEVFHMRQLLKIYFSRHCTVGAFVGGW